jgi:hypothetical protein
LPFIGDLPTENGDFPVRLRYVNVYQRVQMPFFWGVESFPPKKLNRSPIRINTVLGVLVLGGI